MSPLGEQTFHLARMDHKGTIQCQQSQGFTTLEELKRAVAQKPPRSGGNKVVVVQVIGDVQTTVSVDVDLSAETRAKLGMDTAEKI